jgi:hypothetical protein
MTARRSRRERTMAEAEAWLEGYEAAQIDAYAALVSLAKEAGEVGAAWLIRAADAIACMEPEPEGKG